jgi:rhodanese-related sulfurtransferase
VAVGLFRDPEQANLAIAALKEAGFSESDVTLFVPATDMSPNTGEPDGRRGTKSIVAGAVLGGLSGWLAGVRALPIPVLGPYIAAGATALGAGVGTIVGGMAGMGVGRRRLEQNGHVHHTGSTVVVLVQAGNRVEEAERILRRHGAREVEHVRQSAAT